jgi:hypothetical protein
MMTVAMVRDQARQRKNLNEEAFVPRSLMCDLVGCHLSRECCHFICTRVCGHQTAAHCLTPAAGCARLLFRTQDGRQDSRRKGQVPGGVKNNLESSSTNLFIPVI